VGHPFTALMRQSFEPLRHAICQEIDPTARGFGLTQSVIEAGAVFIGRRRFRTHSFQRVRDTRSGIFNSGDVTCVEGADEGPLAVDQMINGARRH
jgi:hypothetical protein